LERLEPRQLLATGPVITEFMASNSGAVADGDGHWSDWIEIHNPSDAPLDLAGYRLTDTSADLSRWVFPHVELAPGSYLVVFASGQESSNYLDAKGNLHTNFRLSKEGEYLALVSPAGTVVSQFGSPNKDFPPQVTDVSYGLAQVATLISPGSPSMFWLPLDESLGTRWTEPAFDAAVNGFSAGTAALGFEARPADRTNFTAEIQTAIREGSHAVYARMPFHVDRASDVNALKLRLKYDNGFLAYLNGVLVAQDNAPANPGWLSTAPSGTRRDALALEFADFDLSAHAGLLVDGPNVLAIHGLNNVADNSDMLLVAELVANQPLERAAVGYLPTPTPGQANFSAGPITGPLIESVTEVVGMLNDNQDLVISAKLVPLNAAVQEASLVYRVMYDAATTVPMVDSGTGADAAAADGIYTAVIPHTVAGPGQMLRWGVTAVDAEGNSSRAPLFLDQEGTRQSPEYFGAVIADSAVQSQLPVFAWFTDNVAASRGRTGARASVFYEGEFYDNVFVRQRGGATNASSQKFVFNRDYEFWVNDELGRVREINMNAQGSDPSFLRQTLAHEAYEAAGNESSVSFLVHMRRNGEFDRVGVFIEQVDEDFLVRNGLDPEGALYKFVQRSNLGAVFSDTITGIEKKTRLDEDLADIRAVVDGLNLPTAEEKKQFLFDNFNIPQLINYLAVRSVTLEADDVRKNFYLYRDTLGTGLWSIFPWDKDWTFGVEGDGGRHLRSPFFGDREHAKQNANQWSVLYDVVFDEPATREMFLRRLRTVMDQFLGPPGTPPGQSYYEVRLDELFAPAQSLLPSSAARELEGLKQRFFERRRTDLYLNHSVSNPDFPDNAGIPDAQVGNPAITFGQIEFDPPSGNQDEEFLELVNPNTAAVDISGWRLDGGIRFTFKAGTVIPAGGSLFVSPKVNVFRARSTGPRGGQGLFVEGDYDGHLSRNGETVSLLAPDGSVVGRVSVGGQPSPAEQFLRITEINYQPHAPNRTSGMAELDDGTPSAADRFQFIELVNTGQQVLDLSGVKFTAGVDFTFAAGSTFAPRQYILVVKDRAAFESRYGKGGNIAGEFTGALAHEGENIFLDTVSSRVIQSITYRSGGVWPGRAAGLGSSLEIIDVHGRSDSPENWRASIDFGGSPGRAGSPAADPIRIHEVVATADSSQTARIELANPSGTAVDISHWYLSNSDEDYFKFRVPAGTSVSPRGFQAFDQSQFRFDLERVKGDELWLIAADAGGRPLRFVDRVQFGASAPGVSMGPWPTASDPWIMLAEPTFGRPNAGPYVGPVLVSEIYFRPADPDGAGRLKPDGFEFIELYNRTDAPVDMSDWRLSGETEFVFPAGTRIGSHQTLTIVGFNPSDIAAANVFRFTLGMASSGVLTGPYSQALDDMGGTLRLVRPDRPPADDPTSLPLILVDHIIYSSTAPWPPSAAGAADALVRTQPTAYGILPAAWIARPPSPGNAAFVARRPGDANEDGQFNSADIVLVLQAGKYLTGQSANWNEGDWNGDGVFDPLDLVAALAANRPFQGGVNVNQAIAHTDRQAAAADAWFERF
jgi:hypothetical protein